MVALATIASQGLVARARQTGRLVTRDLSVAGLAALAATSAGYYFGARLGFQLRFPDSPHSVLWPPNAILLAALLLLPVRSWWWCLLAVLPAHVAISLPAGLPWTTLLGLYLTNASQAVLGAALFNGCARRYAGRSAHARTIIFIVCGVFAAPIALSFADVAIAVLTQWTSNDYWQAWRLRFLSNAASAVIIVPPVLATAQACSVWRTPPLRRAIEGCALALCMAGLGAFVILGGAAVYRYLPLLVCGFLPLLLWGAMRFGQLGASWTLLGLAAVTMESIMRWPVGFAGQEEILMLQSISLLIAIPVLYLGALHSDLRRYVQDLDTIAERYSMATVAASIAVWDWNPRTDAFFVHPHLRRLLGYDEREVTSTLAEWMRHYHPEDRDSVLRPAQACVRGDSAGFEVEHRLFHADGSTRWFLTRGAAVRGKGGSDVKLVGTCVDVTERRRIEDELRNLRHELAHLTRVGMLGELSGALAHEINQPLASILGNAQAAQRLIVREPPDLAEIREALKDIADAGKRAGNVIHQLRDMLKKGEAQFRPLDVNSIVGEVLNLAHSDLIAHQVTAVRRFAFYLPRVLGDRVQLQQVLLNFIMNACEAMKGTALDRRILTVITAPADDECVEICLVDTGSGISPDLHERLFEPFVTTKKDGLGLGLSICRSIVSAHGGRLWAENNAECGAAFHIVLPACRA